MGAWRGGEVAVATHLLSLSPWWSWWLKEAQAADAETSPLFSEDFRRRGRAVQVALAVARFLLLLRSLLRLEPKKKRRLLVLVQCLKNQVLVYAK